jgi:hypothetical protein
MRTHANGLAETPRLLAWSNAWTTSQNGTDIPQQVPAHLLVLEASAFCANHSGTSMRPESATKMNALGSQITLARFVTSESR